MKKLRLCPFCHKRPNIIKIPKIFYPSGKYDYWEISCYSNNHRVSVRKGTKKDAIELWEERE